MARFRLTPEAVNDLQEIKNYIARDSREAARRVVLELRTAMSALAALPSKGHRREDLTDEDTILFWPVYRYLIVYRSQTRPLEILRVVHGFRDVAGLLE